MANKRSHAAMNAKAEEEEPVDPSDELMFLALGGGSEVGRSSHIIQYRGKTIMLDAGTHASYEGFAGMPFFDEFDLSTVDILLISHFHMDHVGTLPYVLSKTNFAGKVYMTHPTKAIYKWLVQDAVRVRNTRASTVASSGSDGNVSELFAEEDIFNTLPLIQTVSFNTTHTHNGIRFTPYPAGHVLGACMWHIEIAGLSVLFTGDYSREVDRHLVPASVPPNMKIDCLITESTFGISTHIPRAEREAGLMKCITGILNRGGRALLPSASVGNTQEILLILEDYWRRHEEVRKFPIYYASTLARKCMVVYQTYIDSMNEKIRSQYQAAQANNGAGPWDFQYVRSLKSLERFDDVGACVMMAAPGMLQNGVSRTLLERWAPDPKNGVVITGYSVEGTMAKEIMREPDSIQAAMSNRQPPRGVPLDKRALIGAEETVMIPRRCTVNEFSFAVHVDGQENREFIEEVSAPVVILVHGERHNMNRLKSRLLSLQKMKVYSPANCEEVRIPFRQDKIARVVGRLATQISPPTRPNPISSDENEDDDEQTGEVKNGRDEAQVVSGVLVQNDFKLSLMAPEDLKEYAGLTTTTIVCRQHITLAAAGPSLIQWALESTFGSVTVKSNLANGKKEANGDVRDQEAADEEISRPDVTTFEVLGGAVRLHCGPQGQSELEWEGNMMNDSIADAVMAVLLSVESSPAAVKQSSKMQAHNHNHSHSYDAFGDNLAGKTAEQAPQQPIIDLGRNAHANLTAEEKLNRLFMFLEAQFGEDSIVPIEKPKMDLENNGDVDEGISREKAEAQELARLHDVGIPVPGLEIRIDKSVAKVWLEKLEVECANKILGDRVRAVVERACETVAPIWSS